MDVEALLVDLLAAIAWRPSRTASTSSGTVGSSSGIWGVRTTTETGWRRVEQVRSVGGAGRDAVVQTAKSRQLDGWRGWA
jgi:hypothetical protein